MFIIILHQEKCGLVCLAHRVSKSKVSEVKLVKSDQKAPFSIATTLRRRGVRYSFLWIAQYHLKNLWYDATWDWAPVSLTIGEHSTHYS